MAKVYEAASGSYGIATDNGMLNFTPQKDDLTGLVFGTLDTGNKFLQTMVKQKKDDGTFRDSTAEELATIIEDSQQFKDCKVQKTVGTRGIWNRQDRLTSIQKREITKAKTMAFEELDEETLKLIIEKKGGKYAPEAKKDALVKLAVALHAGVDSAKG